ncbi:hypothetical protein FQN50_008430 [Emmonsiellopsis sp. PD_5]|nr:hypothetical protein FQN50_008430 [Emmonsiellopsis sp. PD_5]
MHPLQIPEILSNVLLFADRKTLAAAAQVNSLWADIATDWLWRGDSTLWSINGWTTLALANIATRSEARIAWYLKKIHMAYLHLTGGLHPDVESLMEENKLDFPNARSMTVFAWKGYLRETEFVQLLSSKLVCLDLTGAQIESPSILQFIKEHVPTLRSFGFRLYNERNLTTGELLDFLEGMPAITHLEADIDPQLISEELVQHLALRPNLELLSFEYSYMSEPVFAYKPLFSGTIRGPIFQALRCLNIHLSIPPDPPVPITGLPKLDHLQSIHLNLDNTPSVASIIASLASYPLLEDISISSTNEVIKIKEETLLHIARSCPLVRRCRLNFYIEGYYGALNDHFIDQMLSCWPALNDFFLYPNPKAEVAFTPAIFESFARYCPRLSHLAFFLDLDLERLLNAPDEIKFPCLGFFTIHEIRLQGPVPEPESDDFQPTAQRFTKLLADRFPVLKSFKHSGYNPSTPKEQLPALWRIGVEFLKDRDVSTPIPMSAGLKLRERLIEPAPGSRFNPRF